MDKADEQFIKEELILRDYLAADRTMLAVDRTFLSYIRTALYLFVAGVSLAKFFDSYLIQVIGWVLIPSGILTFIVGLERCTEMTNFIHKLSIKHGYHVESDPTMNAKPLYNLTIILKKFFVSTYRSFLHSFLPAAHPTERKS
ncbi:hypothetical protein A2954_06485 [Candidatus Roizmanbacteria bacterium RIFCSPLOWO2_01_FULL_37_12]|uniref:DUF202 domain-containing protein n=1 Tax=Candidatus Roizmanbacteria bacterium RIFCSPLOWO2_01_FULL_37_12 TaxID=1802056 RepID=A0A1F7I9W7_9BACT|nr:MAG: hypothetical protein A2768_00685 [Candidatus Roizmanbacteria bacterium RIFCSPHIGHO2_01_FULL_37_16]OGK26831.1 MAG: hypothetical protein A3D76_05100 [Candidatus Roizmanbacteria bacterium RIFCSPHIGHO2_02_FULL_37_9b]OGK40155.1 MAG: hypothetical protein A2954_06485 [Candidatus Roizmanbacteria bacterium RIFCSPLOWO2_01_FULL_37_12]